MGSLLVFGLIAVVAGTFWLWRVQADFQQANRHAESTARLDSRSVDTAAEVIGQRLNDYRDITRRGTSIVSKKFFITYRFSAPSPQGAARDYETEIEVTSNSYQSLKAGDRIRVRYWPNDPSIAQITSGAEERITADWLRKRAVVTLAGGIIIAIVFVVIVLGASGNRQTNGSSSFSANSVPTIVASPTFDAAAATGAANNASLMATAKALLSTP